MVKEEDCCAVIVIQDLGSSKKIFQFYNQQ
jgi:hypothetical protein